MSLPGLSLSHVGMFIKFPNDHRLSIALVPLKTILNDFWLAEHLGPFQEQARELFPVWDEDGQYARIVNLGVTIHTQCQSFITFSIHFLGCGGLIRKTGYPFWNGHQTVV